MGESEIVLNAIAIFIHAY